jgi:2,3-bisphosphoglycerate-independent phosphoglycerate mutase
MLIIRDGWGLNPHPPETKEKEGNAVLLADTPVQDKLVQTAPRSLLTTSGEAVGLPAGQMGNSEVGHLNIGAGRIVYQDLTRISLSISDDSFFRIPAFLDAFEKAKSSGSRLHLMGLCSDGGVHSHIDHLFALLELAKRQGLKEVYVHCFTDGRDTSPTNGAKYLRQIQDQVKTLGVGEIATITGRYYAMDRDKRWPRTEKAYNALTKGEGEINTDPVAAMEAWYAQGITDEFIPPTVIVGEGEVSASKTIRNGDSVIFFNFRADRARQITRALTDPGFDGFPRSETLRLNFVTMTEYDETFDFPIAFPPATMKNILGQVLSDHGLQQLRMAETEKYPHVTYFFNGGEEKPFPGEDRHMVPSPKVATYDLQPEMSAPELTEEVIARLKTKKYDVAILNYANADMVGHTGVIPAAIQAVETVDEGVGRIIEVLNELGGAALITADHGNAERMLDENGEPYTAHTTFPVEIFYVGPDSDRYELKDGILADIAPTMLDLLGLPVPPEMTGESLLVPSSGKNDA